MSKFAWVTLTTNDTYSLGALVLAHSLKRVGTAHQLAVMVTPTVSEAMRNRLKEVYNVVQEVNVLDSQDAANLALLKRPELGVTFTKLHCWRLVQFEKCVFLDADTLVLKNCDELFEREELSAAPDVSWPDCFNSGVFVFTPNVDTFTKITEYAIEHGSFDGGDQGLLNQYFGDWSTADIKKHLPFVYNVTAYASYCYLPAFKQFRDKIKILHFAGKLKPWLIQFNSETKTAATPTDYAHAQDLIQHWWTIFCDNVHASLSDNMAGLAGALAQLRIGAQRTPEQEHYENLMRRQCWESGQVDYSGADAFDNIWKKITQTMEQKPEKEAEADQTDNDNDSDPDNDNTLGYNQMLTKTATELLQQAKPQPTIGPSTTPRLSLATNQGSSLMEVSSSTAATNQLPTNEQKTTDATTRPQRVQSSSTQTQSMSTQPQHIQQQSGATPARPSRQRASSQLLTSADIEDGKVEFDKATGASTKYKLIEGGYEMITTTPQPNGTVKTQVRTFWDPKPVSEEDLLKEQANKKIIKQRLGKEIRIDDKTTMLTRAIEGGYEEVYTTINEDGTRSTRTKTFFDSVPTEVNENTSTKVNKTKKNVTRKSSVDSTDSTESSSRRIVQKMQKNVVQNSNDSQSNYREDTTVEETRRVSQSTEITENNRTVRKNSLQEQSIKAVTQSTSEGGKKKKKPKSSAPPPPADFVQNDSTTVASKRVPGGVEYTYSTELESGKTITTSKTVYEEEEVELTEEEIKQYKKTLKEAEKHKNVTSTKKLKSESGTKKIVPSENPGDVTTVETIKIEGGTEYHYTTVTSEGIVKKAVKTVFDPVPTTKSNPDDTDEEEIIEEYEEEIIEPGDKIVKTIETVKQLPHKFEEEVTITHEKKEKKVKKTMVISQ